MRKKAKRGQLEATVMVRLPRSLRARLKAAAAARDMELQEALAEAVEDYLAKKRSS